MAISLLATRWRQIIEASTGQDIPFKTLFRYYLIGSLYNTILPGAIGGDVVRTKYLVDNHNVKFGTSIKIAFAERAIGLCGVLFLIFVTTPMAKFPTSWKFDLSEYLTYVSAIGSLTCLACVYLICRYVSLKKMRPTQMLLIFSILILAQLTDALILSIFLKFQNFQIDEANLIFSVALAYIGAVLPISLGGLGVREGILVSLFSLNGIPVAGASAAAMLLLATRLIVSLLGAVLFFKKSSS